MPVVPVDDPDDPRLVELAGLTDSDARANQEAEWGCFIAESIITLETVLDTGWTLRCLLVAPAKLERVRALLDRFGIDVDGPDGIVIHLGTPALLEAVTGFPIHRGVIASVDRRPLPEPASILVGASRIAVLEAVNDHENLGSLFRSAAAFGVDAVLLDPRCSDPLYRRAVRVSIGHVLRVPWTRIGDLPGALDPLHEDGWTTLALTPNTETTMADALTGSGDRIAWVLGAEGPGLTEATMAATTDRVRIPIAPGVDSLNVATAAAVAFAASSTLT